jgi:drug/metabolite transporter (DMT)-like permease
MASGASVGWIFVNLVGSVCVNLGQNVMKLGHNKWAELELPEEERPNIKCIRQWQIGVVVFISGGVATFLSFGYAPQSLLSALGSIQFVSNVVFASFVLKEKVTLRVVVATCGIVAGCILLVIFSSKSSVLLTVPELMSYYKHPAYITYIVCVVVVAAAFYATYRYGKRIIKHPPYPHYWDRLLPVAYMMYASPLGTQAILFSKSVSTLLRATLAGDSQLGYWFTYVILVAFIFTIIFWATRLDKSLKLFPAIVIVPTMQIGWTIFSIISGGIYFQEFQVDTHPSSFLATRQSACAACCHEHRAYQVLYSWHKSNSLSRCVYVCALQQGYSPLQMGMFVLGVATIMVSVFFLTPSTADKYTEMEDMSAREAPLDVTDNTLAEPLSPGYRTSSDEELPQRVVRAGTARCLCAVDMHLHLLSAIICSIACF